MLVLTRAFGQSIMIGDDIEVRILCMRDGKIRVGIEAPKEIPVDRKEVRAAKIACGQYRAANKIT